MCYSHRRLRRLLGILALSGVLLPCALVLYVGMATATRRYTDPAEVPARRVAIVFGAGVRPDGRPSPMLADRVEAAVQLYQLGRVQKILMTGDNSRIGYDEPTAMRRYAERLGVPAHDITLDYAGFSTYESCYRARAIFGVQQAILITQRYHLPRALYTCRSLGIDGVGLGTPDWQRYRTVLMSIYTLREALATVRAVWMVHGAQPLPTFLGPYEGIADDSRKEEP
jgi:vancomycin permeability regulator SanA